MGRRKQIAGLPEALRRELDALLVKHNFGDYDQIVEWLRSKGVAISRSAVHRHGQELEQQYHEAMADARALLALTRASEETGQAGSELAASASTILQTDLVRLVLKLRSTEDPEVYAHLLGKLSAAQTRLGAMSVRVEKYRAEIREQERQAAQQAVLGAAKSGGASEDLLQVIRNAFLGGQ